MSPKPDLGPHSVSNIMFVLWLSLAALACGQRLPKPNLRPLLTGGGEFSIQDVPSIVRVSFTYQPDSVNTIRSEAHRGFDGIWRHVNPVVDLSRDKTYVVSVLFEDGTEEEIMGNFVPEPTALLPPGGKRQANCFFRDDFNNLDHSKWKHEVSMFGGYNWEFQVYTPEAQNSFCRDGHLYIKPTYTADRFGENFLTHGSMDMQKLYGVCTDSGNYGCHRDGPSGMLPPIMSAKLISIPTMRYGHAEICAKLPKGDWIWPAIWMMPKASKYGQWPRSGEIDIMESKGNSGTLGSNTVSSTLHWGQNAGANHFIQTTREKHGPDYAAGFHCYKLEWTEDHLVTRVDQDEILRVSPGSSFYQFGHLSGENPWAGGGRMAPFDQDFFLQLNVAVGGTSGWFPDGVQYDNPKPWANPSTHANEEFWNKRNLWQHTWRGDDVAMQVDYVTFCH